MRHARAIAVLLAMSPASAMAGNRAPNVSDAQAACAGAAANEYLTANAEFITRATANGIMSIDDAIAHRRLAEGFCKRWAACLVTNIAEADLREIALRATFAGCLTNEAKETE